MNLKAGILAIGNEVVEGQITNRNASWLSQQLAVMGLESIYHLSCRDEPKEISQALDFMSAHCHLIIVSGGLGPTKDDRTRQTLSDWLGTELQLREDLWEEIQKKLKSRNLILREGHKNQAQIPEGAQALTNSVGVAPGFFIKSAHAFLASLPGPPSELHSMFSNELKPLIEKNMSPKREKNLYTWACLGAPESDIAHIADSLLGADLDIGFRIHKPYVEVKLWLTESEKKNLAGKIDIFEKKIQPWFVGHQISSIHKNFHSYLQSFQYVFVIDQLTTGLLLEKIKEYKQVSNLRYQCFEHSNYRYFKKDEVQSIVSHMNPSKDPNLLFYGLFPASDYTAWASFNDEVFEIDIPHRFNIKSSYGEHYAVEKSFLIKQNVKKN